MKYDPIDPTDLTKIEIKLTDFGLSGGDAKGGTPIFASPECYRHGDIPPWGYWPKNERSDVYGLGKVYLFVVVGEKRFKEWLYVPIKNEAGKGIQMNFELLNTNKLFITI